MSVGVVLAMGEKVTVRELRHFLTFVTADTDVDADLRVALEGGDTVTLLAIPLPTPCPEGKAEDEKNAAGATTQD